MGHIFVDLSLYGIDDPVLDDQDLRPFIINCLDGIILVAHRQVDRKSRFLELGPMDLEHEPVLREAFEMPAAHMYTSDYIRHTQAVNNTEVLRIKGLAGAHFGRRARASSGLPN